MAKGNMSIKETIRQEIERLNNLNKQIAKEQGCTDFIKGITAGYLEVLSFIDSLPEETSYDINKLTPTPSVNIEDVARVQFASHAHVFNHKRKAVFDWEQFKEVVGIFYGFGKRNSLPEEKPSEDFPTSDEEVAKFLATHPKVEVPEKYKTPNWLFDKQPSEELEEELNKYIDDTFTVDDGVASIPREERHYYLEEDDMIAIARHFAEWQKEQMMKDAVEGKVFMSFAPGHNQMVMADVDLPTNTKVKLIIVKED